jgi:hypothetical protein
MVTGAGARPVSRGNAMKAAKKYPGLAGTAKKASHPDISIARPLPLL